MIRIISGTYKGRYLNIPDSKTTRPTTDKVKQAVFSIISNYIKDATFLDLFAGSGSIGIEAISRGAKKTYLNEKDFKAFKIIVKNIDSLDIDSSSYQLCNKDYRLFLKKYKDVLFDIIYLDPPYRFKVNQDIIKYMSDNDLLSSNAIIISEQDNKNAPLDGFIFKEYKYGEKFVGIYSRQELNNLSNKNKISDDSSSVEVKL